MMNSLRLIARQSSFQIRQFHKCVVLCQPEAAAVAAPATETIQPLTIPTAVGAEKAVSPKIDKIANDITALSLIEVAELSDLLKRRLNLPDAPVMPMGGFVAAKSEDEENLPQQVKSSFTVKLVKFNEKQKVALIKEIKALLPDTNLVQAKKFVESAPVIVKADIAKQEAEDLRDAIQKVGGEVEII